MKEACQGLRGSLSITWKHDLATCGVCFGNQGLHGVARAPGFPQLHCALPRADASGSYTSQM